MKKKNRYRSMLLAITLVSWGIFLAVLNIKGALMISEIPEGKQSNKDPVCNMVVQDAQYMLHFEGAFYQFCSKECRYRFIEHPEKYLDDTLRPRGFTYEEP